MFGRQRFASLCGGMFYVLLVVSVGYGKTIYVNEGAGLGGDGTSWGRQHNDWVDYPQVVNGDYVIDQKLISSEM